MRQETILYLNGQEVMFDTPPQLLYNYTLNDLTNPTVVKNSYSKTITIKGIPQNNKIFNNIYQLDRVQSGNGVFDGSEFNPYEKTEFILFSNGEIYESGYFKLTEIRKTGLNQIEYDVQLYGGLGEFFYNLSYSKDSEGKVEGPDKLELADLHFSEAGWDIYGQERRYVDLGFTINKETVFDAWETLGGSPSAVYDESQVNRPNNYLFDNKWDVINFALCYNGIPSDFGADKVLINKRDNTFLFEYGDYNYALGELPKELTEWQTYDLRSYLQRPVINVKSVIGACCDPLNNGGYEVKLDEHFFNSDNPYWDAAWMTLPMLKSLDITKENTKEIGLSNIIVGSRDTKTKSFPITVRGEDMSNFTNLSMEMGIRLNTNGLTIPSDATQLFTSYNFDGNGINLFKNDTKYYHYRSSIIVKIYAYNEVGEIVAESNSYELTNRFSGDNYTFGGSPMYGSFRMKNSSWVWCDENGNEATIKFNLNISTPFKRLGVKITRPWASTERYKENGNWYMTAKFKSDAVDDGAPFLYTRSAWDAKAEKDRVVPFNEARTKYAVDFREEQGGVIVTKSGMYPSDNPNTGEWVDIDIVVDPTINYGYATSENSAKYFTPNLKKFSLLSTNYEGLFSGTRITQRDLLTLGVTPCDFLLSYCKMFGLYFLKETDNNIIHIMDRHTFFNRDDVVDLEKFIDRGKPMKITPQVAATKWYEFNIEQTESEASKEYKEKYGADYGSQRVNTNYNFDAEKTEVFTDNIFKGGIDVLEKDIYFKQHIGDISPALQNGMTYSKYTYKDDVLEAQDMPAPFQNGVQGTQLNPDYKGYDLFRKPQFHTADNSASDGSMVLLFCESRISKYLGDNPDVYYWLTDDIEEMFTLNESACWLATCSDKDTKNKTIAYKIKSIPWFTRNVIQQDWTGKDKPYIIRSWDEGKPNMTYLPDTYTTDGMSIYDKCWKDYIGDLYSVDNRVLNCYCLLRDKPNPNWLRRFYWFDNCLWRLNKIKDWNLSSYDSTPMEFIKVFDLEDYNIQKPSYQPDVDLFISEFSPREIRETDYHIYKYYYIEGTEQDFTLNLKVQDHSSVLGFKKGDLNMTTESPEWIGGYESEGMVMGDTSYAVHASANNSTVERRVEYSVEFGGYDSHITLIITQLPAHHLTVDGVLYPDEPVAKLPWHLENDAFFEVGSSSNWNYTVIDENNIFYETYINPNPSGSLYFRLNDNESQFERYIDITFTNREGDRVTKRIIQEGKPYLSTSPIMREILGQPSVEVRFIPRVSSHLRFYVEVDSNREWNVISSAEVEIGQITNNRVYFSVPDNDTPSTRDVTIEIVSGDLRTVLTVEQEGLDPADYTITYVYADPTVTEPTSSLNFHFYPAKCLSHTVENGVGTVVFDRPLTVMDACAFAVDPIVVPETEKFLIKEVHLPNTIWKIDNECFQYQRTLTTIDLPNSLTTLGNNVFEYCSSLESIEFPTTLTSMGSNCFARTGLKTITVPSGVELKPNLCFRCVNLESVIFEDGVTHIPACSFYSCLNLKSVKLPSSMMTIGTQVFGDSNKLKEVWCYSEIPPTKADFVFMHVPKNGVLYVLEKYAQNYSADWVDSSWTLKTFVEVSFKRGDLELDTINTILEMTDLPLYEVTEMVNSEKVPISSDIAQELINKGYAEAIN